jgi:cellulose synthase/poly-beta-1,6-N-acetylglucosamine synthase-like glycosyltransferase
MPGAVEHDAPFFSVIIPTRNRPELFQRALQSVLAQSTQDLEVIVVNDGSADEYLAAYQAMEADAADCVSWICQAQRPNGHGPSYSINTGARAARGRYLCILDDDDSWEDMEHLQTARDVILRSDGDVDAYFSNQVAYDENNQRVEHALWLDGLANQLPITNAPCGTFRVEPRTLLQHGGFPHLNCTILHRQLFLDLGGMDEGIRYECEVDLYLRTLSVASHIIYTARCIGRHNVPAISKRNNESTSVDETQKRLSQIRVYQKNLCTSEHPDVVDACRTRLSPLYKHLTTLKRQSGERKAAAVLARVALAHRYSLKWQAYCIYLAVFAMLDRR